MKLKYYSHSKSTYNTKRETDERDFLIKTFGAGVVCPNLFLSHLRTNEEFQFWIDKCSILIVSATDGFVTYGVCSECEYAKKNKIPVFGLISTGDKFELKQVREVERLAGTDKAKCGTLIY